MKIYNIMNYINMWETKLELESWIKMAPFKQKQKVKSIYHFCMGLYMFYANSSIKQNLHQEQKWTENQKTSDEAMKVSQFLKMKKWLGIFWRQYGGAGHVSMI